MSRHASRPAAGQAGANPHRRERPAADDPAGPHRSHSRPRKWFLAVTVLMVVAWIGFLAAMALLG
jgi:hypothetical protein